MLDLATRGRYATVLFTTAGRVDDVVILRQHHGNRVAADTLKSRQNENTLTMLQPHLIQLLSNDHLVVKYGDEGCTSGDTDTRKGAEGNPFTFSPQLIHLNKDHEFFEVTSNKLKTGPQPHCQSCHNIDVSLSTLFKGWGHLQTHVSTGSLHV